MSDIARPCCSRAKRFSCERAVPAGGARRDRTDDLLLAKQALSQLSYGPVRGRRTDDGGQKEFCRLSSVVQQLVGLGRLELPTSRLSSARSNQLSYKPGSEDRGQTTEDREAYPAAPLSSVVRRLSSDYARSRRKRSVDGGAPPSRMTDDGRQRADASISASRSDAVFPSQMKSERQTTSVVRPLSSVIRSLERR